MKKEIYHATVSYKWRTIRHIKGVAKPSKNWKYSKVVTCVTSIIPEELSNNNYFIKGLTNKHKSKSDVEFIVTSIDSKEFICMSNDVY